MRLIRFNYDVIWDTLSFLFCSFSIFYFFDIYLYYTVNNFSCGVIDKSVQFWFSRTKNIKENPYFVPTFFFNKVRGGIRFPMFKGSRLLVVTVSHSR